MELPKDKENSAYAYMDWSKITCENSNQYKLRQKYGEKYDNKGLADIQGRKVIACTDTFGKVGE